MTRFTTGVVNKKDYKMRRNFHLDKTTGEKAEIELAHLLAEKLNNFHYIEKVKPLCDGGYPFDLRLTLKDEDGRSKDFNIEVKSEAGRKIVQWGDKKISEALPTGVVEVWADDAKRKRPEFYHDDVHIIAFKNKARGKFYLYRAQPVIEYLKKWTGHLTAAKNDCEDTSGHLMQFYWSPEEYVNPRWIDEKMFLPGYMLTIDGIIEDDIPEETA